MLVAGVDGCKKGWLVVWARAESKLRLLQAKVFPAFYEVIDNTRTCRAVGVDIPIGLSENEYWRQADLDARKVLGRRRSSVFPAPIRPTLAATQVADWRESYARARYLSLNACGKKMTPFAHGILKKVREANETMTSELQDWIVEMHPEVSFHEMSEGKITSSKKNSEGKEQRRQVLASSFQNFPISVPRGAGQDDFYDACAAAWTASRFAAGRHGTLPDIPPLDARGLRMEIVY